MADLKQVPGQRVYLREVLGPGRTAVNSSISAVSMTHEIKRTLECNGQSKTK